MEIVTSSFTESRPSFRSLMSKPEGTVVRKKNSQTTLKRARLQSHLRVYEIMNRCFSTVVKIYNAMTGLWSF